jgi:RNA polymerase sigma-70 factor (ECF subfamily)
MATGAARRLEPATERTDEELVREAREGISTSFDVLVRRHRARLRRAVLGVLRDRSEVEDVVQQTFLQAFTGLGGFAGTAPFTTWLTRIAMNEAFMRARRSRRVERASLHLVPYAEIVPGTPEQEAASREAMKRVEEVFPRLSVHHREVLQLTTLELSHAAVAERLGVTEGAVKVRLHRAREALRGLLVERERPRASRTPRLVLAPARRGVNGSSRHAAPTG